MRKQPPPTGKNQDPKLRLIRKAMTTVTSRYGISGRIKTRNAPRPITLPRIKQP